MVLSALENMTLSIIGCGNPNRQDDGVGPAVIALLRERDLPSGVRLFDAGTDGMSVLYNARGSTRLIIVDARVPESEPGAIFEVPGQDLEAHPPDSLNLHDFRWDHALFAGRKIYGDAFPSDVTVFLIEAAAIDLGIGLSEAVEESAATVADRISKLARSPGNET